MYTSIRARAVWRECVESLNCATFDALIVFHGLTPLELVYQMIREQVSCSAKVIVFCPVVIMSFDRVLCRAFYCLNILWPVVNVDALGIPINLQEDVEEFSLPEFVQLVKVVVALSFRALELFDVLNSGHS